MIIDKNYKMKPRYEETLKHLNGEVLDIGCHHGIFDVRAIKMGYKVTGLDISPNYLKEAEKNAKDSNVELPLIFASLENLPKDKKYDTIVLMEILEHLENLSENFINIKELLKEDGTIIITVPAGFAHYCSDHKNFFFKQEEFERMNKHWVFDFISKTFINTHCFIEVDGFFNISGFETSVELKEWGDSTMPSYDFFIVMKRVKK